MTDAELLVLLDDLRRLPHETEWVEFKEAKRGYDFRELGRYVSALANEANLKDQRYGWLVFGVRDNDRMVVGSRFRENPADLNHLKQEIRCPDDWRIDVSRHPRCPASRRSRGAIPDSVRATGCADCVARPLVRTGWRIAWTISTART